jgi:hypothetical protein
MKNWLLKGRIGDIARIGRKQKTSKIPKTLKFIALFVILINQLSWFAAHIVEIHNLLYL